MRVWFNKYRVKFLELVRLYWIWEDFKAKRRGEHRIAPRGERGRVYAKNEPDPQPGHHVRARGKATLHMKVTRANGDVEHYDAPVDIEER